MLCMQNGHADLSAQVGPAVGTSHLRHFQATLTQQRLPLFTFVHKALLACNNPGNVVAGNSYAGQRAGLWAASADG